jgi:hypothetical protein
MVFAVAVVAVSWRASILAVHRLTVTATYLGRPSVPQAQAAGMGTDRPSPTLFRVVRRRLGWPVNGVALRPSVAAYFGCRSVRR